jgi:hypothetical protein
MVQQTQQREDTVRKLRIAALAITACVLGTAAGSAPDTLWVKRLDLGSNESGCGIAVRGSAIVLCGSASTGASGDVLVVRMNQDGDTIWTRTHDAGSDEAALSVCLDAESNVFMSGYSMDFKDAGVSGQLRPGAWDRIRNGLSKDQQEVGYTGKYDSLGVLQWFRADTGCMVVGVATDSVGNLYVSGAVNTGAGYDLWFAKLNTSGDTIWTKTYDLASLELGYRLAICPDGSIASCAYVGSMHDFDCLVLRLTPDGDTLWTRRFDQESDDGPGAVAVDPSGNIVVVGRCASETVSDALVLKYSSGGTLLWNRTYDLNTDDGLLGAACDSAGNVYACGYTGADFSHDCLTLKLDSLGGLLWSATYGGATEDQAGDVTCNSEGNPIIAGYVSDTLESGYDVLALKYAALTGVTESPALHPARAIAQNTITARPSFVLAVPSSGRYDIRLCDLTGRTRQQLCHGSLSGGAHRFSLAGLPSGHYVIRVAAPDGGISCQKLVLVK